MQPEDYERDRVGKYADYFKDNEILPIPEIAKDLETRILSLVVTDLKTKRVTGLKKKAFEKLIRTAGIPYQYFCRSFATLDILLPTVEQAARTAATNNKTKHFHLQPEYMGTRRVRVTMCNVPAFLMGDVLASYLSKYGRVEEVALQRSANGTAYGDYTFRICLSREGFQAITEIIISRDRQMMIIVESRRPRCWNCKQLGQRNKRRRQSPQANPSRRQKHQLQPKNLMKRAGRKWLEKKEGSPRREPVSTKEPRESVPAPKEQKVKSPKTPASPTKNKLPAPHQASTPALHQASTLASIPATHQVSTPAPQQVSTPALKSTRKNKNKPSEETPIETTINLNRKRNDEVGFSKKLCPNTPPQQKPPQNQPQPQQQNPQTTPPHTPSLPSFTFSSFSSPELFHERSQSESRPPSTTLENRSKRRTKSVSPYSNKDLKEKAIALGSFNLEAISDFQIRKSLKPLMNLEKIQKENVYNPLNFRGAPPSSAWLASTPSQFRLSWRQLATPMRAWGWRNWSTPC